MGGIGKAKRGCYRHTYIARLGCAERESRRVARSKARKTSGSRGSVRPSNREMEETFLFSSAFVRKIVVSFEIEGWARSLVSGLDIRRLRSAKDRTSSDKFNLRVRMGVRVTRCGNVAANERTKSVGESKGGESAKLKLGEPKRQEKGYRPFEFVGEITGASGRVETANKKNSRHFCS